MKISKNLRIISAIDSEDFNSVPVYFLVLGFALFLSWITGSPFGTDYWYKTTTIIIFAHSLFLSLIWLGRKAVPATSRWILFVIVVASLIRGQILILLYAFFGVDDHPKWMLRVGGGAVTSTIALLLSTLFISSLRRHRRYMYEFEGKNAELRHIRDEVVNELEERQAQVIEDIKLEIRASLNSAGTESGVAFRDALVKTAANVVKPISHRFARGESLPNIKNNVEFSQRINWKSLVSDSSKFGIIPAFEIAFFLNAIAAFWIFTVKSPLNAVIFLAVGFSAFYILLSAANLILKWSKSRLSPTKHAFMMNLLLIAIGALAGINSIVSNKGSRQGFVIGLVEIIFLPLFGWSFMAFGAVQNQRERMEQSVLELNQVLKWEVARARMQQWQHRNWITRTLHGPVQNAIGGSAVKIDLALQAGEPTGLLKTELQEYIDSTIEQLSHFEMQVDFQSNLMQLKGFYAEICKIFTHIDEQTLAAIIHDRHAATATYEIIQEAVWNSIHHGGASEVEIRISLLEGDLIELGIEDNGTGGAGQINPGGLGTSMLEAVTLTWSRTFSKSGTSLRALITVK